MPHIFAHSKPVTSPKVVLSNEEPLIGTQKVSYRPREEWDFEGCTDNAPIDVSLAMPPHRPKNQPEQHRSTMALSSETGDIKAKVCRHCLSRSFNLEIIGTTSDVTVWIPSNFKGFISYKGASRVSMSPAFVDVVLPNAVINRSIPKTWFGDLVSITTAGTISFRVWDVLSKTPESSSQRTDVWKKMFGAGEKRSPPPPSMDWDFLLEDD